MSCIYIIRHNHSNNCYIGSTTDFQQRIKQHKRVCYYENLPSYKYKLYQFVRENDGWDNFNITRLYECEEEKLKIKEQHYMDLIKPSLNSVNAFGEDEEKKKEGDRERSRNYRKNYRDIINEKLKIYYDRNKKKYKVYRAERYEKEKDIISEKKKEKMTCECGSEFRITDKARHYRSLKHQRFLASSSS